MGTNGRNLHVLRPCYAAVETRGDKELGVVVHDAIRVVRQPLAEIVASVPPLGGDDAGRLVYDNVAQEVARETIVNIIDSNRRAPGKTIIVGMSLKEIDVRSEAAIKPESVRGIGVNQIQTPVEGAA